MPMVMFFPLMLFQILLIAFGSRFPMKAKMVGAYALLTFFSFIFLFFSYYIRNKNVSFFVTIIFVLLIGTSLRSPIGVFNAIAQSTSLGLLSAMGNNGLYMGGAMIGNGISGIFTSLLQFFCLACINHTTLVGTRLRSTRRLVPRHSAVLHDNRCTDGRLHLRGVHLHQRRVHKGGHQETAPRKGTPADDA